MLLHQLLARSAARSPGATAVVEPGRSISYRELEARTSAVAAELMAAGVGRGERVLVALPNSIEFVAVYFGVLKAGAIVVPLPPGARSDRLAKAAADCQPSACVVDESTWPLMTTVETVIRRRFIVPGGGGPVPDGALALRSLENVGSSAAAAAVAVDDPAPSPSPTDLAAIIYTSGSTASPRGVMLTHHNIVSNTDAIVEYLGLSAEDRALVVLPFYYVYGLSVLHTHLAVGGSVVIDNRAAFPNQMLTSMRQHGVTGLAGVPSTFALLLHRSNLATTPLPALRYVTQAGGAMAPARIDEWLRAMPGVPFYVMYGATEAAARLTYLPPAELQRRRGSIGRAIPGVDIRVLRDDGSEAPAGEVGELVARGPNIAQGYWQNPDETQAHFGPDGYRTGDLGYADADGFLFLVGRRRDMLKVGAHRVSAREIEDVLSEHPAVHEISVIGVPHDILGEAPAAFAVLRDGQAASARDLIAFARGRLPEHKVPVRVTMLDQMPKTAAGKIDKRALERDAVEVPL